MGITVIDINDVSVERMEELDGWAISEFRLPISGATGSATSVFHSIFRPGSTHAKHLHQNSDEFAIYLSGHGVVGQGNSRAEVSAGHCRLMPKNSEHFFYNETQGELASVIGFYINGPSVAGSGYKFCGNVTADDIAQSRGILNEGILVQLKDCDPKEILIKNLWKHAVIRPLIGSHNGCSNSLAHIFLKSGEAIEAGQFQKAEALYYVDKGEGDLLDQSRKYKIAPGSFVFIPEGALHGFQASIPEGLEMFMVLTGAGSIEEAI